MTKMLSDVEIKKTAIKDKPFKMGDLDGLFLLVNPNGSKLCESSIGSAERKSLSALVNTQG